MTTPPNDADKELREKLAIVMDLVQSISGGKAAWFRESDFELGPKDYQRTLTNVENELDEIMKLIHADRQRTRQAVLDEVLGVIGEDTGLEGRPNTGFNRAWLKGQRALRAELRQSITSIKGEEK